MRTDEASASFRYQTTQEYISRYEEHYAPHRLITYNKWLVSLDAYRVSNRLVELGSGLGYFLAEAAKHGWQGIGIELSKLEAQYAKKRNLNVICGEIESEIEKIEPGVDVIALWDTLEHLPHPRSTLERVFNLLRSGGAVIIRVPNAAVFNADRSRTNLGFYDKILQLMYVHYVFSWQPRQHLYHFSPETMSKLLNDLGFRISLIETGEAFDEKVVHASTIVKRLCKRAIFKAAVAHHWPHEFVVIAERP